MLCDTHVLGSLEVFTSIVFYHSVLCDTHVLGSLEVFTSIVFYHSVLCDTHVLGSLEVFTSIVFYHSVLCDTHVLGSLEVFFSSLSTQILVRVELFLQVSTRDSIIESAEGMVFLQSSLLIIIYKGCGHLCYILQLSKSEFVTFNQ